MHWGYYDRSCTALAVLQSFYIHSQFYFSAFVEGHLLKEKMSPPLIDNQEVNAVTNNDKSHVSCFLRHFVNFVWFLLPFC
jgi:hypothetical protein